MAKPHDDDYPVSALVAGAPASPKLGIDLTKWASSKPAPKPAPAPKVPLGVDLTDAARLDEATRKEGNIEAKAKLEQKRQAAVNNGGNSPVDDDETK
jgi:hypothetical protein